MVSFPMIILSQNLNIHKNDGSLYTVILSDIDSITFTSTPSGFGIPCHGIPTVTYGEQTYNTVLIGDQCWFKENLNIGTKINSTTGGFQQTDNGTIEKYCYNNDEANCDTYGGLYEWTEAMQYITTKGSQGICPYGWHIPTYSEFQTLQSYVGDQATKLIDENAKNGYTYTNESEFSSLFTGYRGYDFGGFSYLGDFAYFWSSTATGETGIDVNYMRLDYYNLDVSFDNSRKGNGFSVRCLKD